MIARAIRGQRYSSTPEHKALERIIQNDLPFWDYEQTLAFYADAVPLLDDNGAALLGCNDRYFLLVGLLGRVDALHPWLFNRCREVEADPDGWLDLWARDHYKSTLITFGGIVQEVLADPEITVGIFSHTKGIAEKFLVQIMREFERNESLKRIFADVLWAKPRVDAPLWSKAQGIILKRKSNPKEATIEAWGLVDGQPTSKHFRLMVYDDVVTRENVTNPEMVQKTTEAWELSDNLGSGGGRKWHIGTRYCTPTGTRITMADWSQKPIEGVVPGDEVVGWELRDGKRWLKRSLVKQVGGYLSQPVRRYTFSDGAAVVSTADHRWWRGAHGSGSEYKPLGMHFHKMKAIRRLLTPCCESQSRDAAWLAGFFDGEGTIKLNTNHPSGCIVITQTIKNVVLIERCRQALRALNFTWTERLLETRKGWSNRIDIYINGGWRERYRFLAEVSPTRRDTLAKTLFAQLQTQKISLVSDEDAGCADVFWLETDTGNYIAEGYASSNSFADTYGVILERKILKPRVYAATENGRVDGKPVFMTQARWDEKVKTQRTQLAAQMLQNPTAGKENTFNAAWLRGYEVRPQTLNVYIMVDPSKGRSAKSDRTAIAVIGIDAAGNKYLLDGYRHRMTLSERWAAIKGLYQRWMREPGVQNVEVGYERYGMQTDLEYIEERMAAEGLGFPITELNWARDSTSQSKKDRVERMEPDVRLGRFFMPALVWSTGDGESLWEIDEDKGHVVTRKLQGETKIQVQFKRAGQDYRLAKPIKRTDETGSLYDVTRALIEEMLFFPFAPKDDMIDACSRIYDMNITVPRIYEAREAEQRTFTDA